MRTWLPVTIGALAVFGLFVLASLGRLWNPVHASGATTAPTVSMTQNLTFDPQFITVTVGTTITWNNVTTNIPHTTTSDNGDSFTWDSGQVNAGGSFPVTFTSPGTFTYHCTFHRSLGMTGTVFVQDVSTSPTPTPTGSTTPTPTSTATPTATVTPTVSAVGTRLVFLPGIYSGSSAITQPVSIVDYTYQPDSITVTAGSTVRWTNNSATSTQHTVTSDDGTSFNSGYLNAGQPFAVTFNTPGTYNYHCTIHASFVNGAWTFMIGSVVVLPQ
jgi:plastocyanin